MALQVGPNLLNASLLGGPADAIGGATPQGAIRGSQAGKGGMPGAGTVPAGLASFGREFVHLLEAQKQADAQAQVAMDTQATQATAAKVIQQAAAAAQGIVQGEIEKTDTDLTKKIMTPTSDPAGSLEPSAESSEAAAAMLLAAQLLTGQPQPNPATVAPQGHAAAAVRAAERKTPQKTDAQALAGLPGSEPRTPLPAHSARAQAAAGLLDTVQSSRAKPAGLPGQAAAPATLASLVQTQAALAGDELAQFPADETAEMEFDGPAMPSTPHEKPVVSTLQHLSGKDFMQTLGSARPASASPERPVAKGGIAAKAQSALLNPGTLPDRKLSIAEELRVEDLKSQDAWRALPAQSQFTLPADTKAKVAVAGQVVTGAGAQPRLTSESLKQVAQSVQEMQQLSVRGHEQGSFRIRLKPDSLGEIHLKVTTLGNQVSLQVQASDEGARKILESSMGDLRDQLISRNLTLASVDVGVLHGTSASSQHGTGQGASGFDLGGSQRDSQQAQNFGNEPRQDRREFLGGSDDRVARALPRGFTTAAPTTRASAGRLDVMA